MYESDQQLCISTHRYGNDPNAYTGMLYGECGTPTQRADQLHNNPINSGCGKPYSCVHTPRLSAW